MVEESRHEDALRAERVWWAEASERQLKEIAENLEQQFRISLDQLRTELAASQERLEVMVERETRARTQAIADVKREIEGAGPSSPVHRAFADGQESQLSSMREQLEEFRGQLAQSETSRADLRAELESGRALHESQKVQMSGIEAALADLRRELSGTHESHAQAAEDLRRDLATFKEKAQLQKESNDEVARLHQFFMQSAGDLGRGIEEVSAGVLALEQKLRRETDQRHRALEAKCGKQHTEVLEALARSGEQLARGVSDEAQKRELEATVLRTRIDALHGQVGELRSVGAAGGASAAAAAASAKETDALRSLVETTRGDLSRLERSAAEDRVTQANIAAELKCNVEHLGNTVVDRLETMEADLKAHVGERLASERSSRALEMADIKSYAEGILTGASKAVAEATANRCADTLSVTMPVAASSTLEQEQVWKELHRLRAAVDAFAALERSPEAEARKAAVMTAVVSRVEVLEERVGQQKVIAARLEGVESELKEVARVPELHRVGADLKRMELDLMPLDSRLDHLESELRRAKLETSPLFPRMDAAESEAARLSRDVAAAAGGLASLGAELKAGLDDTLTTSAYTNLSGAEAAANEPVDLKTNISSLIKKVSMTLSAGAAPGAQSRPGTFPTLSPSSSRLQLPPKGSHKSPLASPKVGDPSMENSTASFRKALQAVKELREKSHNQKQPSGTVQLPLKFNALATATRSARPQTLDRRAVPAAPVATSSATSECSVGSQGTSGENSLRGTSTVCSLSSHGLTPCSAMASAAAKGNQLAGAGEPPASEPRPQPEESPRRGLARAVSPARSASPSRGFPGSLQVRLGIVPPPMGVISAAQAPQAPRAQLVRMPQAGPQLLQGVAQPQPWPAPQVQVHPQVPGRPA